MLRYSSFETLLFNVFQNAMPLKLWGQTHNFCVFLLKRDFSPCNWGAKQTRTYMSMFLFVENLFYKSFLNWCSKMHLFFAKMESIVAKKITKKGLPTSPLIFLKIIHDGTVLANNTEYYS
jgi:hypothetical protein